MRALRGFYLASLLALAACGGGGTGNNTDGGGNDGGPGDGAMGDGAMGDGAMGDGATGDAARDAGNDGAADAAACADLACGPGERCDTTGAQPACVPNTCADLNCAPPAVCRPASSGAGNVCQQVACTDAIQCLPSEYCGPGGTCTPDACVPGSATCGAGGAVLVCASDGSGASASFTCGGGAYFTSACTDSPDGAYCPCEDDWDCPANTACEAGRCAGTGSAPSCRLPPAPFASVLPSPEPGFPWGGTGISTPQAVNSPFPDSAQVVMTPLVINLDDDNGDGLVNENDYPEIVFLSFCAHDFTSNGVLRAVHGGGSDRGKDAWASCASTTWQQGDPLATTCACADADLNSTAGIAAGDLDNDGLPEIVAITEARTVRVYSNRGAILAESTTISAMGANPSPAIANLDGAGLAEIVVGNTVFTLARDSATGALSFVDRFAGALSSGTNGQGPIPCVANVAGGSELEVIAGSAAYRMPTPPAGVTRRADCPAGNASAFCAGALDVVWDGVAINGTAAQREGFCAVADVLGADAMAAPGPANPPDGHPEVILVANGKIQIFDGATGTMERNIASGTAGKGGAPNVDDFDGDGFPEIGTAFSTQYVVFDLQPPTTSCPAWPNAFSDTGGAGLQGNPARTVPSGSCDTNADCGTSGEFACNTTLHKCVCLHNDWRRVTEDDSSNVTGSTVFDFNGDGAAEIIYNDECYFRIYSGLNGKVWFREPSESRTRTENPVVADVDNDGNAEIVFGTSNESGFCSDRTLAPRFNNGIEVWGDQNDLWVSARKVWNEHQYHVTNVLESGGLPLREPESWVPYGGRQYNTYRSQPRSFGVAPNLIVDQLQMSSPGSTCGTLSSQLSITARVKNTGDLRVGPDILVGFYGVWNSPARDEPLYADAAMTPLRAPLGTTLEPGQSVLVTVSYDAQFNAPGVLPDQVRAQVDDAMRETECIETDNTLAKPVMAGAQAADLTVELGDVGGSCPTRTFPTTVRNIGSVAATGVVLRYYLGNPTAGGELLHEEVLPQPVPAGGMVSITATIQYPVRSAVVYVVVDPDDVVPECNDANNTAHTPDLVVCVPG